jgi:esterase/lipase superfamily enzyme
MQEMHLMAHSMGCELVTAALEHLERLNQDGCFSFFFFPTFNWPNHL